SGSDVFHLIGLGLRTSRKECRYSQRGKGSNNGSATLHGLHPAEYDFRQYIRLGALWEYCYSDRITVEGSTRTARIAGIRLPAMLKTRDSAMAPANTVAPPGLTPASRDCSVRPAAYANTLPSNVPATASRTPLAVIIARMSRRCAPRA